MKSFAVRAGLVALFVGFMAFNTTAVAQQGLTFTIFVTTSFGTQFQDCMRFDPVSPGILVVDGLADPLVYAKDDLNFSIADGNPPVSLARVSAFPLMGRIKIPLSLAMVSVRKGVRS
ncbi:hypothetical protein [Candidatus Entotheonella palauensis]|uniref:hypothetical protein n=1 Tax=Candidatus Entotheonella palauensis TaxID=93172 RepID=UPI000B7D650D|nr:hypothetical protein [Candidatus Entotheonella palauensis]